MLVESQCSKRNCRHYMGTKSDGLGEMNERHYCLAFPDGIPEEIAYGKNKHAKPFPGQGNSIVYEKESDQ